MKLILSSRKIVLLFTAIMILFNQDQLFAQQDTTISKAIKQKWPYNHSYPLIKPKYPTYPLMTAYILQNKANQGDPFAQHELGLRYLTGQGLPRDTIRAVSWIEKAVQKNLTSAWFNYAIMLNNGIGVDWNPFQSYTYFKAAAKNGMPEAQFVYGIFLTDNLVVNRNYTEAYYWIKKSAAQDFKPAKDAVKEFQKMGIELPDESREEDETINTSSPAIVSTVGDPQTAVWGKDWELDFINLEEDTVSKDDTKKYLDMIFKKNNTELKQLLGISKFPDSVSTSDTTGIGLITYAVDKGSPEALLIAGRAFQEGVIVEKNIIIASARYIHAYRLGSRKAAEYLINLVQSEDYFTLLKEQVDKNDPDAMYVWAGLIALGLDFQLTDEQALELLEKGVEQNHIYSIIETGLCYYSGTLVEKDREKAIDYWQQAVDLGSLEASVRIAFANIQSGIGDNNESIDLLEKASEEGSVSAQAALAYCYEKGLGVKQNKAEAANLYRRAAHRGSQAAFNSLEKMYDDIRPDDEEYQIYEE
ncbi:MAG: tetratricopeptide repeat protein [Bacteroidota bacterium]